MTADRPHPRRVEDLAELDAGLVDGVEAGEEALARARSAAERDPAAAAVLAALAATRSELAALPAPPLPPGLRWQPERQVVDKPAAIPVDNPGAVSRPGSRRRRWARPTLVAAGLVLGVAVAVGVASRTDPRPPTVTAVALASAGRDALGVQDAGGLADPVRRAGCLRHVLPDAPPDAPLLGARRVSFEGGDGVLLVLANGRLGSFDVAIVDPECGPDGGALLSFQVVD